MHPIAPDVVAPVRPTDLTLELRQSDCLELQLGFTLRGLELDLPPPSSPMSELTTWLDICLTAAVICPRSPGSCVAVTCLSWPRPPTSSIWSLSILPNPCTWYPTSLPDYLAVGKAGVTIDRKDI